MNPSDAISGIAAAAALFALWRTEQTRANLLRAGWDTVRADRKCLRSVARATYARFVSGKPDEWPREIEALVGSAGLPPNVPIRKAAQIKNWYDDNHRYLSPDQRRMWEFASAVYPTHPIAPAEIMEKSIVAKAERAAFDESRRNMATFFHRQWEATSSRQLFSIVPHTNDDVILLSWFELALVRATKDAGPGRDGYGGKRGLFEYGKFLQKRCGR